MAAAVMWWWSWWPFARHLRAANSHPPHTPSPHPHPVTLQGLPTKFRCTAQAWRAPAPHLALQLLCLPSEQRINYAWNLLPITTFHPSTLHKPRCGTSHPPHPSLKNS